MRLEYEPSSEPLHISVRQLFSNWLSGSPPVNLKAILSKLLCARFDSEFGLSQVRAREEGDEKGRVEHARPQSFWLVAQPSKSAAHRDKSREWNVSKQKWNLC